MKSKTNLHKETDYETRFRCAGGFGILREEIWVDRQGNVMRYNLAFLLPHLVTIDNGRVLSFDNAHGAHERHFLGSVIQVVYRGYASTARRFYRERKLSGELMKTVVLSDGFEGHVKRSLERAEKRAKGNRLESEKIITFADPLDLMQCITTQRVRLCQVVRRKPLSITALAAELGRNRGSVTRDVNKLKAFGLLRLREQVNPGHGVLQIVEPVAGRLEMRVAL